MDTSEKDRVCGSGIAGESANMDREVFLDHLLRASTYCREFTTRLVFDSLPGTYAFWVLLNCSYDRNPLKDGEVVFPDDLQKHGKRVGPLTADAVVSLLWRDHMVPEWIDISVWEADQHVTYFELIGYGLTPASNGLAAKIGFSRGF
jgi:hypothetical protein